MISHHLTTNKTLYPSLLMIMHSGLQLKRTKCSNFLQQDLLKLAMWCAKWRIKLNPEKTKVIFSRSMLARKAELNLKLYGEILKIYPQVNSLGIIFGSKLTFQPHFEDILERCNNGYYRLRLLANKNGGLTQPP